MRQVHTGLVAAVVGLTAVALMMSGCPKTPKTATQTTSISEGRPQGPVTSPPAEVITPPPVVAEERQPEALPVETKVSGLADIYFEFDRSEITPAARTSLEQNAKWLIGHSNTAVTIEGHCDERGTNEYNLALGERRAQAVKRVLVALGVATAKLSTVTYGEEQPVCREHQESCYQKNRRAHFAAR
ncbi:MAG: peptidoglycan-associated lipoprotein Pal [Nitrospirae bacterium]|nr:peptidoglycan-associated lipoprotein Pal [Nitrospirota bacterium]